ncbi:MAG: putative ThiF/HesA family dinucleotide-utilizing enzyme, partial [Patiriisocius sp.]
NSLVLHPNPANETVIISFQGQVSSMEVTFFDALGRKVFQKTVQTILNNVTLDISELPSGLYYVALDIAGARTSQKLIKQ